jgi:hypothetical protein
MSQNRKKRPPKRRYENKRRRLSQADQFVQVYNNVLKSEAWRNCSGDAIKIFMHLCTRSYGGNNGMLAASMRNIGEACAISKDKANRCIDELLDWGLIEIVSRGSWAGRKATKYGIMMRDCHVTGRPAVTSWERAQVSPLRQCCRTSKDSGESKKAAMEKPTLSKSQEPAKNGKHP